MTDNNIQVLIEDTTSSNNIDEETILNDITVALPLRDNYDFEIRKILKNPIKSTIRITSFMVYKSFFLKEYKHYYGNIDFKIREITKTIGKAWNKESQEIKEACKQLAEELTITKKERFKEGKVEQINGYKKKSKRSIKSFSKTEKEINNDNEIDQDNIDLKKIIKDQEKMINSLNDKVVRYKKYKKQKIENNDINNNNILSLLIPRITQIEKSIEKLKLNQNTSNVRLNETDLATLFYNYNNFQIPIVDNTSEIENINENNSEISS